MKFKMGLRTQVMQMLACVLGLALAGLAHAER